MTLQPTLRVNAANPPPCSGSWATHAVASLLGGTLRLHRRAPSWWRKAAALPFRLFTGLLRRRLGRWVVGIGGRVGLL